VATASERVARGFWGVPLVGEGVGFALVLGTGWAVAGGFEALGEGD